MSSGYARYWDLSEKDRSELTSEQVEAFIDAELMEQGVVRVEAPTMLPVEVVEIPTQKLFVLKRDWQTCTTHGYKTAEAAARAMADAIAIDSEYVGGNSYSVIDKNRNALTIEMADVYTHGDLANVRKTVEQIAANKKANDKATQEYKDACTAVERILDGLWENYRECQSTAYRNQRVIDTYNSYVRTANDNAEIAANFLAKAFTAQDIDGAFEWFGLPSPLTGSAV